jgi:hypothetical protein
VRGTSQQDSDLADEGVLADLGHLQGAAWRLHQHVGLAPQNDVGGIGLVALDGTRASPGMYCARSAAKASSFSFAGSTLANSGIRFKASTSS